MTINALSLQTQSVIYGNKLENIARLIDSLYQSFLLAQRENLVSDITYAFGDCSPEPLVANPEEWCKNHSRENFTVTYNFFNENKGHGGGHNALAKNSTKDILGIVNPDVVASPQLIPILVRELEDLKVGISEANQVPFEHPKDYDLNTRETSFSSGCCFFIRRELYEALGGIDHETFFMYCDDVDFSWRVRLAGKKLIFNPDACVYHDHRLEEDGTLKVGFAERYYSALGALLLAHKWGRPDVEDAIATDLRNNPGYEDVLEEYEGKKAKGDLPKPIENAAKVALFTPTGFANYRWTN